MAKVSIITDELKKLIGVPWEPQIFKVEEGAIKRYAEAIDDPNPLYNDVEYARKSKYGRLICPPGFTGWPQKKAKLLGIQVSEATSIVTGKSLSHLEPCLLGIVYAFTERLDLKSDVMKPFAVFVEKVLVYRLSVDEFD